MKNQFPLTAAAALILPLNVSLAVASESVFLREPVTQSGQQRPAVASASGLDSILDQHSDTVFFRPQTSTDMVSEAEIRSRFLKAVRIAHSLSPALNRARAESEAAVEGVKEARGQRWPQIDVSSASRTVSLGSGSQRRQSDVPALQVNMVTNLYDFGQISNTIESRQETARAAKDALRAEQENTAWEVSSQLIELSKQKLIIEISQQYVARMKELTRMLAGIAGTDAGRRSEYTQARGELLKAQSALEEAVSRARDTEITLYKYLGNNKIMLPVKKAWALVSQPEATQIAVLENHPVIEKARAQTKAALAEAKAVRASGLPALNWTVTKNTGKDEYDRTQALETGIQISWGIFRGGSTRASERAAVLRAEASRQEAEEQLRDLAYRVRSASQDATSLSDRAALYASMVSETDRIRTDFFDQWYHLGKRTLLDVLSAESEYYGNRVGEVSSRFDSYEAIFRGYASSGNLVRWLAGNYL